MPDLIDTITVDAASVRTTRDGYVVADARAARIGVQLYRARELGLTDRAPDATVRVYRPAAEVFHADAMASLAFRPMTNDHPASRVTADNWRTLAVGNSGGEVVRDGDFVRVPLVMMDATAISDFQAGKRELSVGYSCELEMKDGVAEDGQAYDAVQHNIRANHIALCHKARGGDMLRIGDQRPEDQPKPGDRKAMKTIIVDGIPVADVSEAAEAVIAKLQSQITAKDAALAAASTKEGELTAQIATKDGEIAGLNAKLKDAEVTPEKLALLAQDRANLVAAAKPLLGDSYDFSKATEADIRRAAVAVKLPDAKDATKMDDAAVAGAFRVLTAGTAVTTGTGAVKDGVREVVKDGAGGPQKSPQELRDAAVEARRQRYATGYHGAPVEADA